MTVLPTEIQADEAHAHDHPPHLAHHFDNSAQQFEAGKLGMWLFLATEVLLFGGLFCIYTIFRYQHPEMFAFGSRYLDTKWGAINTGVLIASSVTMACAVTCARRNRKWTMVVLMALTFLGGAGFMGIKYVEYTHKIHENLVWGTRFYERPLHGAMAHLAATDEPSSFTPDPDQGREIWTATCRSCHGTRGQGIAGQGKDMRGSAFINEQSDEELLAFVKAGRMPFDPANTTGIQMPPRGGNPLLDDDDLRHVIAFMRTLGLEEAPPGGEVAAEEGDEAFWIPRSSIPDAPPAPPGLDAAALDPPPAPGGPGEPLDPRLDPSRPANAHLFFAIYFMMTGLHGIHVLVGMAVIGWLVVRGMMGHFGSAYFTPVDLGGLYWHVVDLIWIFLFPLFYLIG